MKKGKAISEQKNNGGNSHNENELQTVQNTIQHYYKVQIDRATSDQKDDIDTRIAIFKGANILATREEAFNFYFNERTEMSWAGYRGPFARRANFVQGKTAACRVDLFSVRFMATDVQLSCYSQETMISNLSIISRMNLLP